MSDRVKSSSEKKIEKSLGITQESLDKLADLSDLDDNIATPEDDSETRIEQKKEQAKELQKKLSKLSKLDDKEFARQMYREIALSGFELLQTTKAEMEIDPSPRYVEVIATLNGSVSSAMDSLRDIDNTDREFELEDKKLTIKDKRPPNVTNIAFTGDFKEVLKNLKNLDAPTEIKTIDVKKEE